MEVVHSRGDEEDKLVFDDLLLGTFVYVGSGVLSGRKDNSEARMINGAIQIYTNREGEVDFIINIYGLTSANEHPSSDFLSR